MYIMTTFIDVLVVMDLMKKVVKENGKPASTFPVLEIHLQNYA